MTGGSTMTLVPPYCSPLPSRAWIITEKVSNTHTQTHISSHIFLLLTLCDQYHRCWWVSVSVYSTSFMLHASFPSILVIEASSIL